MAALTQEHREYSQQNMVDFFVEEARRNDAIQREYPDPDNPHLSSYAEELLSSLARQAPNRIYFAEDGRLMRVLFFGEERNPYQARIEVLDLEEPNPRIIGSEILSVRKLAHMTQEIQGWRRRFDMTGDLLSRPLYTLQSLDKPGEIVHIGGTSREEGGLVVADNMVYCRYYESTLGGARLIDLGVGPDYKTNDNENLLPRSIPSFMRRHIAPFPTPIP